MNILITGGNGYIAKSLYLALNSKYNVTAVNRDNFDLTNNESTNIFFKHRFFDVVIHCAVKGGSRLKKENSSIIDNNLKMYYNLLDNKLNYNKLIHFGSGAEIYSQNTPYGLSKHVIRQSILDKDNFYNLRIFAAFDENELDTRFIKSNIKRYINKESIQVYQNKYMDFIYMPDLIRIVEYYINNDNNPKEVNCNYSTSVSLVDIANIINSLDNYKVNINIHQEKIGEQYKDTYTDLGIKFMGLEQGIKKMYSRLK